MPGPTAIRIKLSGRTRRQLEATTRTATAAQRDVLRARIVLLAAAGETNAAIARRLGCTDKTVRTWRARFATTRRPAALRDAPRTGRPPRVPDWVRCEVVQLACDRPGDVAVPFRNAWTVGALRDALAAQTGWQLSMTEVRRTLTAEDLRPHRVRPWLHSPDPDFRRKVRVICALYAAPPPGATVVCVDEKTGMQALDRLHPGRPAARGRAGRFEFEYRRRGTRVLLAALDVRTGRVFARCVRRRRAVDLGRFLTGLARHYPTGPVYVVWDNLNIHAAARWAAFNAAEGGRFHFVYTPKHASWVNQVECWFSILQRRVLRHGSFATADELAARVRAFVRHWNRHEARPCRWTFRGCARPVAAAAA